MMDDDSMVGGHGLADIPSLHLRFHSTRFTFLALMGSDMTYQLDVELALLSCAQSSYYSLAVQTVCIHNALTACKIGLLSLCCSCQGDSILNEHEPHCREGRLHRLIVGHL